MKISAINTLLLISQLGLALANRKCIIKNSSGSSSNDVADIADNDDLTPEINNFIGNNNKDLKKLKDILDFSEEESEVAVTDADTVTEEDSEEDVSVDNEENGENSEKEEEKEEEKEKDKDNEDVVDVNETEAAEDVTDNSEVEEVSADIEDGDDSENDNDSEEETDGANKTEKDSEKTTEVETEIETEGAEKTEKDSEKTTEVETEIETEGAEKTEKDSEKTTEVETEIETEVVTDAPTSKVEGETEAATDVPTSEVEEPTGKTDEPVTGLCVVDPLERVDCGDPTTSKKTCIEKGCCWGETDIANAPWCFYSSTGEKVGICEAIDDADKVACKSTTEDACLAETDCCWKESNDEKVPSCYYNRLVNTSGNFNPDAEITVRFLKPNSWKVVNLWSWDGGDNLYGGPNWPGKAIEDLGNGWWSHTFPKGIALANVIFNNGEADNTIKTYDITNVVTSTCFKLVGSAVITTTDCGLDLEMCHADASERIQCGSDKITEDECVSINCCYSELAGAPSCFYGVGSDFNNQYGTCVIEHELRSRCGEKDITEDECGDLGCCWDLSEDKNYPSCFYHGALVPTCSIDIFQRSSCGYGGISESECVDKYGCCYDQNSLTEDTRCYFQDVIPSGEFSESDCTDKKYKVKNLKKSSSGMTATLDFGSQKCGKYDADITSLDFAATFETDTRLHLKVTPSDLEKYPHNADIPKEAFPFVPEVKGASDPEYVFDLEEDGDFNIVVKRKNGKIIFNTLEFVFEQQYLQITTSVPVNANIYGIGEIVSEFKRNANATRQALFALDSGCPKDSNIYGHHPFYIEIAEDGSSYGFFLKNAHGQDFILEAGKLSFKINGGNFDMYFFMGPTPEDVVAQYHKAIGQPALMPYWTLGWHQCRYGYKNLEQVEYVLDQFEKKKIPVDTMWIDIDFMDSFKDFTYDEVNFPPKDIAKFVDRLHEKHLYYINMVDPAISTEKGYKTYDRGVDADIFVKNADGEDFVGKVWPGLTVFPDWFNPKVEEYWTREFKEFKDIAMTDGNWIDMNEAANFCNGACSGASKVTPFKKGVFNPNNPPYVIFNNRNINTPLNYKTLDMDATHYGGHIEYDVHNLYGHMESIVTNKALRNIDPIKRPFLLSRSTFAGTGSYAAHWLGDNASNWDQLHWSIPGMLNFQMFGIPLVGADICGFNDNATEELCARWHELGAFYPFARNHNSISASDQEAIRWESVSESARRALAIRYEVLPYLYTLLIRTHTDSGMIVYPQAFIWPTDSVALDNDEQFLFGKGMMITPVLKDGARSVNGYFPAGKWYDWYDPTVSFRGPTYKKLDAPLEHIPVHIRGGYIIPTQGPKLSIYENRRSPFGLIVALDAEGKAKGELYLDDGSSIDIKGKKSEIKYAAKEGSLTASGSYNYTESQKLATIKVLGVESEPSKVVVEQGKSTTAKFTYKEGVLIVEDLAISMNEDFTLNWA
jgi:alpha-glucosidase (family GH31 glycosyl hydrolase)